MNNRYITEITLAVMVTLPGASFAETITPISSAPNSNDHNQVIVQIGGRFGEYVRQDVASALPRFPTMRQVEFFNDHGTVLITYGVEGVPPSQLAASVEEVVSDEVGVERGGSRRKSAKTITTSIFIIEEERA